MRCIVHADVNRCRISGQTSRLCVHEVCAGCHQLKTTSLNAVDGAPGLILKNADAAAVAKEKRGGFQDAYTHVNVRAMRFNKPDQDRCIYGFTAAEFKKLLGSRGSALMELVKDEVSGHFTKKAPSVHQVHVLFHWNDHSFFTYHKDGKGHIAVMVNLAPACTTDFHVAGASEKAKMHWPGHTHILPTNVYHRSGTAPRRCIKLVFFLDLVENKKILDLDEGTSAQAAPPMPSGPRSSPKSNPRSSPRNPLMSEKQNVLRTEHGTRRPNGTRAEHV